MTMKQLNDKENGHSNIKIKYDKYDLCLKGKYYHVLIPNMEGVEAWITPGWIFHDDVSFIDGNSQYFKVLYNIAVTLTLWPDYMIYLPLRDVQSPPYCPQGQRKDLRRMDALFYNHQIQLVRSKWIKLRNMTKRLKPQKITLKYNPGYLTGFCKCVTDAFLNNKAYWLEKSDWQVFYEHFDTLFVEGSRSLYAQDIDELGHYLQEKLQDASIYGIRYHIYALGIENAFFIPSLYGEYVQ